MLEILKEHTIGSRIKESDVCRSLEVCIRINICIFKYYITRICILTRITPFHELPLSARNCVICHGITLTNCRSRRKVITIKSSDSHTTSLVSLFRICRITNSTYRDLSCIHRIICNKPVQYNMVRSKEHINCSSIRIVFVVLSSINISPVIFLHNRINSNDAIVVRYLHSDIASVSNIITELRPLLIR